MSEPYGAIGCCTRLEKLEDTIEQFLQIAAREPLAIDISDYGDEWCAGFLEGQVNVLLELAALVPASTDSDCEAVAPVSVPAPVRLGGGQGEGLEASVPDALPQRGES